MKTLVKGLLFILSSVAVAAETVPTDIQQPGTQLARLRLQPVRTHHVGLAQALAGVGHPTLRAPLGVVLQPQLDGVHADPFGDLVEQQDVGIDGGGDGKGKTSNHARGVRSDGLVDELGEIGEICFRGYHIMRGYYGDEEATQKALDESGWLYSADLGVMDAEGYVSITGRLKEMIIRGGENIYPREIEDFLFTHPKISEVQVFGVPDPKMGEEVCAWIQLEDGAALTEDEVKEFCKGRIADYKVPDYVAFTEMPLPRNPGGKILKAELKDKE